MLLEKGKCYFNKEINELHETNLWQGSTVKF